MRSTGTERIGKPGNGEVSKYRYPEHRYPTPTRNLARYEPRVTGECSEVREGWRCTDGTIVYFLTESEVEAYLQSKRNDALIESIHRTARMQAMIGSTTAAVDTWAAHA